MFVAAFDVLSTVLFLDQVVRACIATSPDASFYRSHLSSHQTDAVARAMFSTSSLKPGGCLDLLTARTGQQQLYLLHVVCVVCVQHLCTNAAGTGGTRSSAECYAYGCELHCELGAFTLKCLGRGCQPWHNSKVHVR